MGDLSVLAASSGLLGGLTALLAWLLAGEAWASKLSREGLVRGERAFLSAALLSLALVGAGGIAAVL